MTGGALTLALLLAGAAQGAAPAAEKLVTQVSVLQATEKDVADVEAAFNSVVAEYEVSFVSPAVARELGGGRRCSGSAEVNTCLAELARRTKAQGALFVVASVHGPEIILTGRVTSATGEIKSAPATKAYPKKAGEQRDASLKRALRLFFTQQLGFKDVIVPLTEADTSPVVEQDAKAPDLVVPEQKPVATRERGGLRTASYGLLAAGVLLGGASGVLYATAAPDRDALAARLDGNGEIRFGDVEAFALEDRLRSRSGLVTATMILSAATLVAGGALFLVSGSNAAPSVALTPEGAAVAITVSF